MSSMWNKSKGQTELEFMLILPFFLATVFGLLVFVMLVFKGQMLTYATYMAGRTVAVKSAIDAEGDANTVARKILPGVRIKSTHWGSAGEMTVTGSYQFDPVVHAAKGSQFDVGMSDIENIRAELKMYHFQPPKMDFEMACNVQQDDNCYTTH